MGNKEDIYKIYSLLDSVIYDVVRIGKMLKKIDVPLNTDSEKINQRITEMLEKEAAEKLRPYSLDNIYRRLEIENVLQNAPTFRLKMWDGK